MQAQAIIPGNDKKFARAQTALEKLTKELSEKEALVMTHSAIESLIQSKGMEVLRLLMEDHILLRGDGEVEDGGAVIGADNIERTHQRQQQRKLTTIFGDIEILRLGYGKRGTKSLRLLDADLNLPPEKYSHGIQRVVAHEVPNLSFEKAVKQIERTTGAEVPKRQVEELAVRAAQDFDEFYENRKAQTMREARKTGSINVITTDGKGVVVHHQDLRPATLKQAEKKAAEHGDHTFSVGLPKSSDPARDRKRMATVAAAYTVAPFVRTPEEVLGELIQVQGVKAKRPRPENKRVWASLKKGPEEVIPVAFEEAHRRDPKKEKDWVGVVDGNETQIILLENLAKRQQVILTIILDFIHVAGYVWKAGHVFHERGSKEAQTWVRERLLQILHGKASLVAAGMRRSATLRGLPDEQRKPVDTCADYLLKYSDFLHYDRYLAAGFPIASGVIEGACRYLVEDRMGITGAVWRLNNAEAVLKLRSLHASEDFDEYWEFHENQELERNHSALFQNETIPKIKRPALRPHQMPARGNLKLVS